MAEIVLERRGTLLRDKSLFLIFRSVVEGFLRMDLGWNWLVSAEDLLFNERDWASERVSFDDCLDFLVEDLSVSLKVMALLSSLFRLSSKAISPTPSSARSSRVRRRV